MSQDLLTQASGAGRGFDQITVLVILMFGLVVVFSLLAFTASTIARRDEPSYRRWLWFRIGGALTTCAAACVYLWGVSHVAFMEADGQRDACVRAGGEARAAEVDGYDASYLPLRFVCRIDGGESYPAAIPPWINPAFGVLSAAAFLVVAAAVLTRDAHQANQESSLRKGNP